MVLLQERETLARCDNNLAIGGIQFTGEDFQKSRLTCAVGSDETIAVTLCKFDIYILKQGFFTYSKCYVICTNHILLLIAV